ncbi:MAG: Mov34/MPN/PAD-1 family protein [Solirubrobacteraceae bacterium]
MKAGVLDLVRATPTVETGGLIFGSSRRDLLEGWEWVGPGANAEHGASHYRSDGEHDYDAIAEARSRGLELVASFHSHPNASGAPSDADLDMWAKQRQKAEVSRLLGLLVIRLRDRWSLDGYIVRRGAAGRDICEPASIT